MATLSTAQGEFWRSMLSAGAFKPGQGKYARWGTFAALVVLIGAGFYNWNNLFGVHEWVRKWAIPAPIALLLTWLSYRLINYPRFADFLITTEAEMAKVKWPTWRELRVATMVVLITVVLLAVFLFWTDIVWRVILGVLGILRIQLPFGSNM